MGYHFLMQYLHTRGDSTVTQYNDQHSTGNAQNRFARALLPALIAAVLASANVYAQDAKEE
jgi:hypothetical protein